MLKNNGLCNYFKVLFFSLSLALLSTSVLAFEGREHNDISMLAIYIAVDYNCPIAVGSQKNISTECEHIRKTVNHLLKTNPDLTYGRINELVDFMHYPEQIFEHYNYNNAYPPHGIAEKPDDLNKHVISLREDQISKLALFDYLSASSHNERHFQDALMESMHYLHKSAIIDAKQGYIYSALVRNALSDHYLNDFFAPGHITTARENSHDTVALAMHDLANKNGSCFLIDEIYWDKLEPILEFIQHSPHKIHISEDINNKSDVNDVVDNINECDVKIQDVNAFKDLLKEEPPNNSALRKTIVNALYENHEKLYLQGDDRLKLNPVQQLFMILVQVKSISEVMQAYIYNHNCPGTDCNNTYITNYSWKGSYDSNRQDGTGVVAPKAKTKFGRYDIVYNPSDKNENETVSLFFDRPKYAYPAVADNVFLFSLGGQTPVSQESSRFEAQLELFPLQIGTSNQFDFLRDMTIHRPSTECVFWCNLGLSYGISYIDDDYFTAGNLQLRIIKAFPKVSTLISASIRRGKYWGENETKYRTSYGIRYDHGFSLHSFYIGYEWGYGFDENAVFHDENLITFGWTLTFPSSRLLDYFGWY